MRPVLAFAALAAGLCGCVSIRPLAQADWEPRPGPRITLQVPTDCTELGVARCATPSIPTRWFDPAETCAAELRAWADDLGADVLVLHADRLGGAYACPQP